MGGRVGGGEGDSPGLTDVCCLFFRPRGCSLARTPGCRAPLALLFLWDTSSPSRPLAQTQDQPMSCGLWSGPVTVVCWIHSLKHKTSATPSGLHPLLIRAACSPGSARGVGPGLLLPAAAPRKCVCDCPVRATAVAVLHGAHRGCPCPAGRLAGPEAGMRLPPPGACSSPWPLPAALPALSHARAHAPCRAHTRMP